MKINSKAELKALIKECLVEILSDGSGAATSRPRTREQQQIRTESHSNHQLDELPATIPSSMKSLFSDSQRRATEKLYQDNSQVQKQSEVLGEMADTWSSMAFTGAPLPSRAMNPREHVGSTLPPNLGDDDGYHDDGFDPYEAVKSAASRRR